MPNIDNYSDRDIVNGYSLWGEAATYLPRAGGSRLIQAIIDRNIPTGVAGVSEGNEPNFLVGVRNSLTAGISSSEIDTGGDHIQIPPRLGGAAVVRRIDAIRWQDSDEMLLEVN